MICPFCDHKNIEGVDACDHCGQDLTAFDREPDPALVETQVLMSPLARFRPRRPVIVPPGATVAAAVQALCEHRIGCVLVGSADEVVGIFSERDVLLRVAHRWDEVAQRPVSEFMTPDPVYLEDGNAVAFLLNRMSTGDFRHMPVLRDGRVAGVFSLRDVLGFLAEWYPELIEAGAGA